MIPTNSLSTFIAQNDSELRRITNHLCISYNFPGEPEDIVQDIYVKFLTGSIIENYEEERVINKNPPPNPGKRKLRGIKKVVKVKMSTYLYSVIRNYILSKMKTHEYRVLKYKVPEYSQPYADASDLDKIIQHTPVEIRYQNLLSSNEDNENSLLWSALNDFRENFLSSKKNKKYSLNKRRNQEVRTSGCSLIDIFNHLYEGYNNKEIAEMYGVSDMSITNMKHQLAWQMKRYGFGKSDEKVEKVPIEARNGHKALKIRDLRDDEKERILNELFLPNNGQISNDACVAFKKTVDPEIAIFQITGYIVGLHRKVKNGLITIENVKAYEEYLRKRREMWSSWKSSRYQALKEKLSKA